MVGHRAVFYLPEACNPDIHRSVMLSEAEEALYRSDICTFGTLYYYRQAILEHLCGYDLKVWGNVPDWLVNRIGSRHLGRGVYEEDKCKAVAGAKIVLNSLHYGEIQAINCRAFEVAGCGGFQLMSYTPAVAEHFEIGKEVEVFHSRKALIEKIDYYLARPEKRAEIAAAGQRRAYAEHTYRQRLATLIDIAGRG
jgi:spore maturation protein CgeB